MADALNTEKETLATLAASFAKAEEALGKALAAGEKTMAVYDRPYLLAAKQGDMTAMRALLFKGANMRATDDCGNSALFFAAQSGQLETVKFLLESGIDVNVKNRINSTPLMGAAGNGHFEVAKLLVERGSDPFYKNATGMSAYGYAGSANRKDMQEFLMSTRVVTEVDIHSRVGDRRLCETFNFATKTYTSVAKGGPHGYPGDTTRKSFDEIEPAKLRNAFTVYKQKGGKLPETDFFAPAPAPVAAAPAPAPKKRWWKF